MGELGGEARELGREARELGGEARELGGEVRVRFTMDLKQENMKTLKQKKRSENMVHNILIYCRRQTRHFSHLLAPTNSNNKVYSNDLV